MPKDIFGGGWLDNVPPPCDEWYNGIPAWQGPRVWKLCGDTLDNFSCGECCYTIVYYFRWRYANVPGEFNYDVNVTGIFWEGEGCASCPRNEIINRFYLGLMQKNSTRPSFLDSLNADYPNSWDTETLYLYSTQKCINGQGNECDEIERCCVSRYQVSHDPSGFIDQIDTLIDDQSEIPCPINCSKHCKAVVFQPLNDVVGTQFCDMPCNTGVWKLGWLADIPYPGCEGCKVFIWYIYRETENCDPNYKDIQLTQIDFYGSCFCAPTGNQIDKFAWECLINYAQVSQPDLGFCDTTYRAITAPCWKDEEYLRTYEVHDVIYRSPCVDSGCCWTKYEKCNPIPPAKPSFTKLASGSDDYFTRCWTDHFCEIGCEWMPESSNPAQGRIVDYNETSNQKTRNSSDNNIIILDRNEFDINIFSLEKGPMQIYLYNSNGELIQNRVFNKSTYNYKIKNSCEMFTSGLYYYISSVNNKIIQKGSILIIK